MFGNSNVIVMEQYISKSALVAEIERQISAIDNCPKITDTQISVLEGDKVVLIKLLSFIDTLKVKEVDSNDAFIEKAVKWLEDNAINYWGTDAVDNGKMMLDFKKAMRV